MSFIRGSIRHFSSRSCGIIGLPNIGKSTLFNALTNTQKAEAANFPFCTIKPNIGIVSVPDERLLNLARIASSKQTIGSQLEFVDIAGLIKGASKGLGLGNQFLGNIRQVSVLLHVLRCYEDTQITHVENTIDPIRDAEIVNTELLLADLETAQRRLHTAGKKHDEVLKKLLEKIIAGIDKGIPARNLKLEIEELGPFQELQLLTAKPIIYVCNTSDVDCVSGNEMCAAVAEMAEREGSGSIIVSAKLEDEVSQLEKENRAEFLGMYGLTDTGLSKIIKRVFSLLGLKVFFTVGKEEARAWIIPNDATACEAAGQIHSDIARGFISAETISYSDWVENAGNEATLKKLGRLRIEGRDYKVADGDIFHFRFNV